VCASSALERVRRVARKDRDARFTALLHHVDVDRLRAAYRALSPRVAAGVDEVTWQDYGQDLEANLRGLHARVHRGAYRAKPSRRVVIAKADGRLRPLGVAALEDKIVQRAVVEVLNAIYEADFLGFSYGFRPGPGPHDALDALVVGIERKKVSWVLDADFRDFFTSLDHSWLVRFLEHRIADKAGPALDPETAQGRGDRGRGLVGKRGGIAARCDDLAAARKRLPALRLRSLAGTRTSSALPAAVPARSRVGAGSPTRCSARA
jgi:Reverse transcriptase (RNA-dependent DNA polymerase)